MNSINTVSENWTTSQKMAGLFLVLTKLFELLTIISMFMSFHSKSTFYPIVITTFSLTCICLFGCLASVMVHGLKYNREVGNTKGDNKDALPGGIVS